MATRKPVLYATTNESLAALQSEAALLTAFPDGLFRPPPRSLAGAVIGSAGLHTLVLVALGFVTWSTSLSRSPRPEFAVRLVPEDRVDGRSDGAESPSPDLARLRTAEPLAMPSLQTNRRPAPMPKPVSVGMPNRAPSHSGAVFESIRRSDVIGLGGAGEGRSVLGTAATHERNGAGPGPAIGTLWGVGQATPSASFVYVLDRSGSMQDAFLLLQNELIRAIGTLNERQRFDVIWFSEGTPRAFSHRLVAATLENKRAAFQAIRRIVPTGRTEPLEALRQGLALEPDVLYFLSDGDFGEQNHRLLELVRRAARRGRTVIHTILFVYDTGGQGESILRQIAEIGRGTYKHVAEEVLDD